jgi:hypothetical protein
MASWMPRGYEGVLWPLWTHKSSYNVKARLYVTDVEAAKDCESKYLTVVFRLAATGLG